MVGVGGAQAQIVVYIGNRPPLQHFAEQKDFRGLVLGEIGEIAKLTGNHWRKIFNCYAKLSFALDDFGYKSWQIYRDQQLLQSHDSRQLLFSAPVLKANKSVHIVSGKNYFQSLNLPVSSHWIDEDFAIAKKERLIVCPYFDYRQLSNQKISRLTELILAM